MKTLKYAIPLIGLLTLGGVYNTYATAPKTTPNQSIKIEQLKQSQIQEAKEVYTTVWAEIYGVPIAGLKESLEEQGFFNDLNTLQSTYFNNFGTFLVLMDNDKIVGMVGLKRLRNNLCEGKKLVVLKEYRQQGLATKLAEELLKFAQEQRYKKIILQVLSPEKKAEALAVYKQWGFSEIKFSQKNPTILYFEKKL